MNPTAKRILLIEPPFLRLYKDTYSLDRYPLSLGYLAGAIKRGTDWDVRTYNVDFSPAGERTKVSYLTGEGFKNYLDHLKDPSQPIWQEIKSKLLEYGPSIIGISVKSQNYGSACNVARLAKEINPDIRVVAGGPHPSMVGCEIFNCPSIDVGVQGEGEETLVELLKAMEEGDGLSGIKGIVYKRGDQIFQNPPRELIEDLDSLPFPHQTAQEVLIDYEKYPFIAFKNIFAIRGCPFNCFYCGSRNLWSRRVRFRSPENVIQEINSLQKFGLRSIHFDDDTFGVSKKYVKDLLNRMILDCPGLKWSCEFHVKLVDDETLDLMKSAGCYLIQIGIESGSNTILRAMRKDISIEEALKACDLIKRRNIELQTFFMVGFPQETEETLNDTLKAIRKIKSDSLVYNIFTPYPGTEAFAFCQEKRLIGDNFDLSLYNHQSPLNCFCMNIDRATFRARVAKIEKYIDRKNAIHRIKRLFSTNVLWRIQEQGIQKSIREVSRIIVGK